MRPSALAFRRNYQELIVRRLNHIVCATGLCNKIFCFSVEIYPGLSHPFAGISLEHTINQPLAGDIYVTGHNIEPKRIAIPLGNKFPSTQRLVRHAFSQLSVCRIIPTTYDFCQFPASRHPKSTATSASLSGVDASQVEVMARGNPRAAYLASDKISELSSLITPAISLKIFAPFTSCHIHSSKRILSLIKNRLRPMLILFFGSFYCSERLATHPLIEVKLCISPEYWYEDASTTLRPNSLIIWRCTRIV